MTVRILLELIAGLFWNRQIGVFGKMPYLVLTLSTDIAAGKSLIDRRRIPISGRRVLVGMRCTDGGMLRLCVSIRSLLCDLMRMLDWCWRSGILMIMR